MSLQLPPYRPVRRRSGLRVMAAATHALFMRELQTRFGGYRLGYLWVFFEIAAQILVFMLIFGTVLQRIIPGMAYPLFLAAGMPLWFMLVKTARRSLDAIEANKGLMEYRAIKPIDTLIARSLLETVLYWITFVIFIMGFIWLGIPVNFSNLLMLFSCWIGMWLFAFGLSLIMMVVGLYFKEISRLIAVAFTVMYFMSGIIYSIHVVPEPYINYLLYNPLIHNIEFARHALAPSYPIHHIDISYFYRCTIVVLFLGLLLYKYAEKDMIRSR